MLREFIARYWPRREIRRVRIQPGDVIVLRTDAHITAAVGERIVTDLKDIFPGHKVIILPEGNRLQIVSGLPEVVSAVTDITREPGDAA